MEEPVFGKTKHVSTSRDLRKMIAPLYKKQDMTHDEFIMLDMQLHQFPAGDIKKALMPGINSRRFKIFPEVQENRLIIKCPFCTGAMAWEKGEDFYCMECHMKANDGRALKVNYDPDDVDAVIALLEKRPELQTRNWRSIAESVKDIKKENALHGIE